MTDGINLLMGDDGVFHEAPEPYMTIMVDTEEDWNALQDVVNRGNRMCWISVKDKLPEPRKKVLVFVRHELGDFIDMARYFSDQGWHSASWPGTENVTHWMPLPKPPKEDEPK